MSDPVSGPGFHTHLFQEGGLGKGNLAVATEAEQVNQYRYGQRRKRPEDLGVDELHLRANLAPNRGRILLFLPL